MNEFQQLLTKLTFIRELKEIGRSIRCETCFLYPEGSSIDIFIYSDVIRIYKVECINGALRMQYKDMHELADKIFCLEQACVRVSDLYYTK